MIGLFTTDFCYRCLQSAVSNQSPGYLGSQNDVILPRVGAFIVDHVISFILGVGLALAMGLWLGSQGAMYLGALLGLFGYFIVLEGWSGQTVGKRLFGVIVVSRDGSPITFRQSLARNLLRVIDGILNYALGLVVMLVSQDRQRIGDHAAGTLVVRAR